jgi:tRNA threonylcarbamoyladenosine biosynthesis protein TsaE
LIISKSTEETIFLGRKIGKCCQPGEVIGLQGELGVGKTYLTKGIVGGIGFNEVDRVKSPCFKIINHYSASIPVVHLDLYRIENEEEIFDLGLEEIFPSEKVVIIEWVEKVGRYLPSEHLLVRIKKLSADERGLELVPKGKTYQKFLEIFKGKNENLRN